MAKDKGELKGYLVGGAQEGRSSLGKTVIPVYENEPIKYRGAPLKDSNSLHFVSKVNSNRDISTGTAVSTAADHYAALLAQVQAAQDAA